MAINSILKSNESKIYLCKKIGEFEWAEPIKVELSVVPTTSTGDIMVYGENFPEFLKGKCSKAVAEKINVGDRIYYNKEMPLLHNKDQNNTEDANYEVISRPSISINVADIRLRLISER